MELRPRLNYESPDELRDWTNLLEKARVDGPASLLFNYEGEDCVFEGPFRTVEDMMKYHRIDPNKYIGKPVESTYWETTMRTDTGHITVPNHRLKAKIIPKPIELLQFKEFAEGLPKFEVKEKSGKIGHLFVSDIHMGAVFKDYKLSKITELLSEAAQAVNERKYEQVFVHVAGDIIETTTGQNHPGTWKDIEMFGADLIKEASKILAHFFDQIDNLSKINIVGGNHDRMSEKMDGDKKAGAADLISYILEVRGYPVNFDPFYIVEEFEDHCFILEHGHFGLSKQNPYEKIFRVGKQDKFNMVIQGHFHNRKMTRSPDGSNYRLITCPPLIPSTAFGHELGMEGTSGILIIEGGRKPVVIDYTL